MPSLKRRLSLSPMREMRPINLVDPPGTITPPSKTNLGYSPQGTRATYGTVTTLINCSKLNSISSLGKLDK